MMLCGTYVYSGFLLLVAKIVKHNDINVGIEICYLYLNPHEALVKMFDFEIY